MASQHLKLKIFPHGANKVVRVEAAGARPRCIQTKNDARTSTRVEADSRRATARRASRKIDA